MNSALRRDAGQIISASLAAVLPDEAVRRALADFRPGGGRTLLAAAGKAAWQMAQTAVDTLGGVDGGVVITKYGHVKGRIPGVVCCEAGHPVPDENSFSAAAKVLDLYARGGWVVVGCGQLSSFGRDKIFAVITIKFCRRYGKIRFFALYWFWIRIHPIYRSAPILNHRSIGGIPCERFCLCC